MDFEEFMEQFDKCELGLSKDELLLYSRQDLSKKENIAELVFYPDNMIDDWQKNFESLIQVPAVWVLHDKDNCEDLHGHCIIQWNNNVQLKYFLSYFNQLFSKSGINPITQKPFRASALIKMVKNPDTAYKYLYHDQSLTCCKDKAIYSRLDLHHCNGFDIHFIVQIDKDKKRIISREFLSYIESHNILDMISLSRWTKLKDNDYYDFFESHSGYLDRLCAGNWKKSERKKDNTDKKGA